MAPRSRTGCLTCRQRKLKCSEERPVCAQCIKAHRECIPSSGITFRHQQNPSMNGTEASRESLKSFYGYKETFGKGTVWVDVPQELTFVHTSNPYDDEDAHIHDTGMSLDDTGMTFASPEASTRSQTQHGFGGSEHAATYPNYSDYATHGLEALSAVASQDQYNYAPPPATMSQVDAQQNSPPQQHASASPTSANSQAAHAASQGIDFLLNPPSTNVSQSTGNNNIDPRLHSPTSGAQTTQVEPFSPADQQPATSLAQPASPTSPSHVRTSSYASSSHVVRPSLHHQGFPPRYESAVGLHDFGSIDRPDVAFLLRDYSERAGLWMDLFDLSLFFATKVPVLAVGCPLLLYSCIALSAKSLSRVSGRKPIMGGQVTPKRQSQMELWPEGPIQSEDWVRKAREYYDLAISLLRQALAGASRPPTASLPVDCTPETRLAAQGIDLPSTDSDELVAATAILCVYEFLDASGSEWSRHLDGAKSLFDIAKDRMMPLTIPPSPVTLAQHISQRLERGRNNSSAAANLSRGRVAIFWNFARQDMLSAFINNTCTRLDTEDLPMWRSAGLKFTADGNIAPSNPAHPDFDPNKAMADDVISNALIWLLMKLVNFIAAGDELPESFSPLGLGVRQNDLLDFWHTLETQLQAWYDGLPSSFHATATIPSKAHSSSSSGSITIEEKWFPRPMCASTMQSYHFARIQLLHNKPHLSTSSPHPRASSASLERAPGLSLAARHASYASILSQSRAHAKEIVAIALGRSDEGTRIHSVQPLWTAGLVLGGGGGVGDEGAQQAVSAETEMWRRVILGQLRGIERDMGWASEYRVQSLLNLWGLPDDWEIDGEG